MRLRLMPLSLAFVAASCQSAERGTPANATASDQQVEATPMTQDQGQPAQPETAMNEGPAQPAPVPAEGSPSAALIGVDCALDVALECSETEVDGCLTGQTIVHQCVSMNTP